MNMRYTPAHREFFVEFVPGHNLREIAEEFSTEFSARQISSLRHRLHLVSGIDTKFKKGSISHNKGKTGSRFGEKGWFKPGHVPHNHLPVGAEVIACGYKKVKIAEPNVWKFSHVLEWERHNGPVPQGHCVVFKDGCRDNCAIENLMLITQAENAAMNKNKLRAPDPALTEAALAVLRLKRRISEIEKKGD